MTKAEFKKKQELLKKYNDAGFYYPVCVQQGKYPVYVLTKMDTPLEKLKFYNKELCNNPELLIDNYYELQKQNS